MTEKKRFKIPNQINSDFHVWRFITLKDILILLPTIGVSFIIYKFFLPENTDLAIGAPIALFPTMVVALLLFITPIKERPNIKWIHYLQWRIKYNQSQHHFLLRKRIFEEEEEMSKKKKEENSTVDIIPVRNIYNEMIETKDNRLVKIFSVSSINLALMSYAEEKEVLEGFEVFLRGLRKPIQICRVAEPINMKTYIKRLNEEEKRIGNPYKKRMLKSYIDYSKMIQEDREMIRRNCYLIIYESFTNNNSKEKAIQNLKQRAIELKLKVEEMLYKHKLEVVELGNDELRRYLYQMFDYENAAQAMNMEDQGVDLPYIIGKRSLMEAAESLKRKKEYRIE